MEGMEPLSRAPSPYACAPTWGATAQHPISLGGRELPHAAALILRCGEHHVEQLLDADAEPGGISLMLRPHGANVSGARLGPVRAAPDAPPTVQELRIGTDTLKLRTVAERPEMDAVLRLTEAGKLQRVRCSALGQRAAQQARADGWALFQIAPVCGTMTVRDGGAAAARRPSKSAAAAPPASKKRSVRR